MNRYISSSDKNAQLSQRNRAMFLVIEYSAKSLKVTRSDTLEKGVFFIALSCTVLALDNIVTLKCGLEVTQDHSNWYHAKAWVRFPIRLP